MRALKLVELVNLFRPFYPLVTSFAKGVALAGVAGGFLKSSFCGLLPMKQHLFKVGLIWLDSKLGQLERASVGEFGFSYILNSVGMTRTHTRPVAVFNIIECFSSVV